MSAHGASHGETSHQDQGRDAAPFTEADIAHFHHDDLAAGRAVVCLMVGIFSIGVVLYTIVAVTCAT